MRILRDYATPLALLLLSGVLLFNRFYPAVETPLEPSVNALALGRAYAPKLVDSYAEGWLAAAKAIEEGKPVVEAQNALQEAWKAARAKAFAAEVQPGMSLVLPEGTEPSDAKKRSEVAELWRAFARGLKSSH
ncbi:MAG: hypothetical protein AB7I30_16280 [Isosphaeraceae bacterium]